MLAFDPEKDARNLREREISLARFADMEPDSMLTVPDVRRDYGEPRLRVFGRIHGRLHLAVITRRADVTRVISLRRANEREQRTYAKETQSAG